MSKKDELLARCDGGRVLMAEGGGLPEESSRARAARRAPGFLDALGALSDTITGGLHGAAKVALGWPGDMEKLGASLVDSNPTGATVLPTSEDFGRWLPQPTQFSIPREANPFTELGGYAPLSPGQVAGLARPALQASKRVAQGVGSLAAEAARRGVEEGRGPLGGLTLMARPHYAVRPRGGNFDSASYEGYVEPMYNWEPEGTTDPVNSWLRGPLAKYVAKDMGSPSDPLLAVEKELPNLHLPPGQLEPWDIRAGRVNNMPPVEEMPKAWLSHQMVGQTATYAKQAAAHRALTQEPLTAWGAVSDSQLRADPILTHIADRYGMHGWAAPEYLKNSAPEGHLFSKDMTPEDQALAVLRGEPDIPNLTRWQPPHEADEIRKKYGWALKNPEAKIWSLVNTDEALHTLGFGHVRDYLNAATAPYREVRSTFGDDEEFAADVIKELLRGENNGYPYFPAAAIAQWRRLNNAGLLIDPDHLPRTSVADAVRKTAKWNEFLASQQEANPGLYKGIAAVHKEYPEHGMRWVRLGLSEPQDFVPHTVYSLPTNVRMVTRDTKSGPEYGLRGAGGGGQWFKTKEDAVADYNDVVKKVLAKQQLDEGLNAEGDAMGHCVGGYCDDVAERGTEIYSLRDKDNRPHVTVEVRPGQQFEQWHDRMPDALYQAHQDEFIRRNPEFANRERVNSPEWVAYLRSLPGTPPDVPDIIQIKGKQNAAPVEKYLPFVQDFVKSGNWGRVRDLENTGLHRVEVPRLYQAPNGAALHFDEGFYPFSEIVDKLKAEGGMDDTTANAAALRLVQPSQVGGRRGYAHGGSVQAYTPPSELTVRGFLLSRI